MSPLLPYAKASTRCDVNERNWFLWNILECDSPKRSSRHFELRLVAARSDKAWMDSWRKLSKWRINECHVVEISSVFRILLERWRMLRTEGRNKITSNYIGVHQLDSKTNNSAFQTNHAVFTRGKNCWVQLWCLFFCIWS